MSKVRLVPSLSLDKSLPFLVNSLFKREFFNFNANLNVIFNKYIKIGIFATIDVRGLTDTDPARLIVSEINTVIDDKSISQNYVAMSPEILKPLTSEEIKENKYRELVEESARSLSDMLRNKQGKLTITENLSSSESWISKALSDNTFVRGASKDDRINYIKYLIIQENRELLDDNLISQFSVDQNNEYLKFMEADSYTDTKATSSFVNTENSKEVQANRQAEKRAMQTLAKNIVSFSLRENQPEAERLYYGEMADAAKESVRDAENNYEYSQSKNKSRKTLEAKLKIESKTDKLNDGVTSKND